MSESVASALEYLDNDATQQTHLFIQMIDKIFECKGPQVAKLKRKDDIAPYIQACDERFTDFILFLFIILFWIIVAT